MMVAGAWTALQWWRNEITSRWWLDLDAAGKSATASASFQSGNETGLPCATLDKLRLSDEVQLCESCGCYLVLPAEEIGRAHV